jgi:membrane protein DedA with SNARE-associated domain
MIEWVYSLLTIASNAVAQHSFEAMVALFFIAALTEIGVPFPFIIDGALFITSFENGLISFQVLFVILALTLGRIAGSTIIFWLSRLVGDSLISWLGKRFPKLKIVEKMSRLNVRLRRRAPYVVAVARLTPGLLIVSSVAAGYCGIRYYQLVLGIILASVVADGALVIVGFATKFGFKILGFTPSAWEVVLVLVVILLLAWFVSWLWQRYRNPKTTSLIEPENQRKDQ